MASSSLKHEVNLSRGKHFDFMWLRFASYSYLDLESSYDYTLMVTGVTGNGKSALCNFLSCSNTAFETGCGFASITDKSAAAIITMQGIRLKLIDTPGFCDDYSDEEEHMREFGEALVLASEGVNAIALVISAKSRYTTNEKTTIDKLAQFQELWPFMFIIFTHAYCLGSSEEDQKRKLLLDIEAKQCPPVLHDLMQKVSNRYILVESIKPSGDPEAYYQLKTKEVRTMINGIYKAANNQLYSNELFIKTKQLLDKLVKERSEVEDQLKLTKSSAEEDIKRRLNDENALEQAKLKAQALEEQKAELEEMHNEKQKMLLDQGQEQLLQKEKEIERKRQELHEACQEKERLQKELSEKQKIRQEAIEALKKLLKEEYEKHEMLKAEATKEKSTTKWYRFLFKKRSDHYTC